MNPARAPVLVAFLCPACAARQAADLVAISRAGAVACTACQRRLTNSQVSRGIERARAAVRAGVMN